MNDILRPKSGRQSASPRDFQRLNGESEKKGDDEDADKPGCDPFSDFKDEEEEAQIKPLKKSNSRKLFQNVGRCRSEFYESVPEPEYVKKHSEREALAK